MKNQIWDKDENFHANVQPVGQVPTGSALNVSVVGSFMSDGREGIVFADSPSLDAFSRLRVSTVATVFESMLQYDLEPIKNFVEVAGAGAVTHLPNESAATLSTGGGTLGDKAILQSKRYIRYQAGKSQLVFTTGIIGAPKAGVVQRTGLFDDNNGIFFEQSESGPSVVVRSDTSGTPVENRVYQADWGLDRLDGLGPSGATFDPTKTHIFVIDFQWLGVGRIRVALDIDGKIFPVHQFVHANYLEAVYMATPHLPVRSEIQNIGAADGATTMKRICAAVVTEGGLAEEPGNPFAIGRGTAALGVTTRRPVLSIRPSPSFLGRVNRGHITLGGFELLASTNSALYEVVVGGVLATPTWVPVDVANSISEYDTASTGIVGGRVVNRGWVVAGQGSSIGALLRDSLPVEVHNSFDGTAPETLSIVCTAFTGTSNLNALMRWTEQR